MESQTNSSTRWDSPPAFWDNSTDCNATWQQQHQQHQEQQQQTSSSSTDPSLVSNWTDADLWAENEAIARKLVPAMVFVGALMVVGTVGNSLVVYVYAWRVKPTTQYFLILCLACSDLLICLIPMPTEIADMRYHLTFSSPEACRLLRFINLLSFVFSIFILLVIAVDRYRRVCRPIGRQMTLREARWGAVVSAVMALVMAWPMLVLTGLRTTITRLPGLYGHDCSFSDDFHNTPYPLALNVALGVGFLIMTFTLAVLYFHIWYHARGHPSFRQQRRTTTRYSSTDSVNRSSNNTDTTSSLNTESGSRDSVFTLQKTSSLSQLRLQPRPRSMSGRAVDKTTIVAFTVTLVFVFSFLPYLIIMFLSALMDDFDYSRRDTAVVNVYNIFLRFYFINSAANPIIYGALSARFRSECRVIFQRLKCVVVSRGRSQSTSSS